MASHSPMVVWVCGPETIVQAQRRDQGLLLRTACHATPAIDSPTLAPRLAVLLASMRAEGDIPPSRGVLAMPSHLSVADYPAWIDLARRHGVTLCRILPTVTAAALWRACLGTPDKAPHPFLVLEESAGHLEAGWYVSQNGICETLGRWGGDNLERFRALLAQPPGRSLQHEGADPARLEEIIAIGPQPLSAAVQQLLAAAQPGAVLRHQPLFPVLGTLAQGEILTGGLRDCLLVDGTPVGYELRVQRVREWFHCTACDKPSRKVGEGERCPRCGGFAKPEYETILAPPERNHPPLWVPLLRPNAAIPAREERSLVLREGIDILHLRAVTLDGQVLARCRIPLPLPPAAKRKRLRANVRVEIGVGQEQVFVEVQCYLGRQIRTLWQPFFASGASRFRSGQTASSPFSLEETVIGYDQIPVEFQAMAEEVAAPSGRREKLGCVFRRKPILDPKEIDALLDGLEE